MSDRIKELLKVLDLPEDDQLVFVNNLWQNRLIPDECDLLPDINGKITTSIHNRRVLADLAFRLRDKADDTKMHNALYKIQQSREKCGVPTPQDYATAFWGLYHAKPIHWIIAVLIAQAKGGP